MLVHTYINKKNGMGLGDFIRGSLATKQLCMEYDIPFEIDFRCHPISQYLINACSIQSPESANILDLQDIHNMTLRTLKNNLKNRVNLKNLRQNNLHIYTNVWPVFKLSKTIVNSVRHHMRPTEQCETAIATALGNYDTYEVIHVRAGDLLAFGTQIGDVVDYTLEEIVNKLSIIKTIKEHSPHRCIIMSDSAECKRILSEAYGLECTSTTPTHMALENNSVLDTLVDFFILSRAQRIHQFSVHHWGSGFSDSAHWLYKVPIVKYKLSSMAQ